MIIHNETTQEFSYLVFGTKIAKLQYRYLSDEIIDAFHTKVSPEFEGQGIAGDLYDAFIDFVQQEQLKVKPSCSYILLKMERKHSALLG